MPRSSSVPGMVLSRKSAVKAPTAAPRLRFGVERRLWTVFEPRTNTSRRAIFQNDYAAAFDDADRVYIHAVPETPLYSATGPVTERLDADALARAITARGTPAFALPGARPVPGLGRGYVAPEGRHLAAGRKAKPDHRCTFASQLHEPSNRIGEPIDSVDDPR